MSFVRKGATDLFGRDRMTLLDTNGSAFSDELSMLTDSSSKNWWELTDSEAVGARYQPLLDRVLGMEKTAFSISEASKEIDPQPIGAAINQDSKDLSDRDSVDLSEDLNDVDPLTGGSLSAALVTEPPAYPGYLLSYTPGITLEARPGVAQWQAQMQRRGWSIDVDGLYGPASRQIAIAFQREKGLVADGIVGPQTWQAAFDESTITTDPEPVPVAAGRLNDTGLNLIKDFEGLRLNAYQDAVGVWTIGYGHTNTAYPGQRITNAQATELLRQDVANFENAVTRAVRVPINENQFAALVSFAYNVGSVALNSSTLLRRLNADDTFGAANEFLRWNRAGGRVLAGLTRRREAERSLFLS